MKKEVLIVALCFFVIGIIIYFPGIDAPRYGDDFGIVPIGDLGEDLVKVWTTSNQRDMFYRPIDDTISVFIIHFWGYNTLPIHLLILLFHIYFVTLSYYIMIKLKLSRAEALTASLFMLVAQGNVFAVGSNDTIGSTLSSVSCLTALWFLFLAVRDDNSKVDIKFYLLSLLMFIIGVFTKEQAVAFIPMLIVLILYKNSFFSSISWPRIKRSLIVALPFFTIFIIYFIIHSAIVPYDPAAGEDNYNFRFGLNVPKNIGMLLFSAFLPLSSVRTFDAVMTKDYKFLAAALGLTVLFAGTVFLGIWKSKKIKTAALVLCFLFAGLSPFLLLNHVNEHYTYISMPFFVMLIGIGMGYYINNLKGGARTVFITLFSLFLLMNCYWVMEKSSQMNETGKQANELFGQIKEFTPLVQHNGVMVLVNPAGMPTRYSVYRLPGFETMRYAYFYIYRLAGRSDFKVEIINPDDLSKWRKPEALILGLDGNKVVQLK